METPKVLITNKEIEEEIKKLARKINADYNNEEPLNLVCVLKGAVLFFSHLVKYLKMPVIFHFVQLSSYSKTVSSGKIDPKSLILPDFCGQNVLIIEDILDTGLTLKFLIDYIEKNLRAKSTKLAVLLDKKANRKYDIKSDYFCFEIEDKFIVGFGLDYDEKYRNLDYIGYFEKY